MFENFITYRFILCFLLCSFVYPSAAQNDSLLITVNELFERGMNENLKIRADRLKEQIAHEQKQTARMALLPNLEIGLNAGILGQPIVFQQGLGKPTRPETPNWSQNYAINLNQPLYQGGKIRYSMNKTDIEETIARLQTATDAADLKLTLLAHYLNLFNLYKQYAVLTRTIEESEHRLVDIHRMKREGLITNNDVLRSEMQLTNNRLARTETSNNITIVSQQLDILLGLDETLLLIPDTFFLNQTRPIGHYSDYIETAYENDPAFLLIRQQTRLAENNIKIVRSDYLPKISLYAANTLARPVSRTLADMYNNNWNVGLSLSYSLSSLYQNKHKINEAYHQIQLQHNAEEQKQQQIRMTIQTAYLKHEEALQQIEALNLSVKQAAENYRIMQNRYLNQLAILTDLLDADNIRLNAELQLIAARTNAIYTYYELQKACGRL